MKLGTFKVDASDKGTKVTMNLICSSKCPGETEAAILVEEY